MFKWIFLCVALCIPYLIYAASFNDSVTIKGTQYSYSQVHKAIESILPKDPLEKYNSYTRLTTALEQKIQATQDSKKNRHYEQIGEIFALGQARNNYILESQVHSLMLWYSSQWREIYWYFKGIPENGYKLIVSNIHGAYEYGTYETAMLLIDELKNSDASGWFIVPTLNPDGLQEYFGRGEELSFYIWGRANENGVDLNRNFCTNNFLLTSFKKFETTLDTAVGKCESEQETQVMIELLNTFTFNSVISLHSRGGIFYVPDGSIDDARILELWKKLLGILPEYDFSPKITTESQKQASRERYEMDEGGKNEFTGTMETYIYEQYNIPVVLIELTQHGKAEERLKNVFIEIQ